VPLPITFATLGAGNQPLSDFDTQFNALAVFTAIPCSASGTNAIALTTLATAPVVSSYSNLAPSFIWFSAAASTGPVTINVNGIGALPAYKYNGTQVCGAGDIANVAVYRAVWTGLINGGGGGAFIVDALGVSNTLSSIEFVIDGGGSAITTGIKGYIRCPIPALIYEWGIMADQGGSIVVDIFGANNAIPTTSIVGVGNKPTLSAQQYSGMIGVSGWTNATLGVGEWIAFSVSSASNVTRVTVVLDLVKI
jgi:hypothetical protein